MLSIHKFSRMSNTKVYTQKRKSLTMCADKNCGTGCFCIADKYSKWFIMPSISVSIWMLPCTLYT